MFLATVHRVGAHLDVVPARRDHPISFPCAPSVPAVVASVIHATPEPVLVFSAAEKLHVHARLEYVLWIVDVNILAVVRQHRFDVDSPSVRSVQVGGRADMTPGVIAVTVVASIIPQVKAEDIGKVLQSVAKAHAKAGVGSFGRNGQGGSGGEKEVELDHDDKTWQDRIEACVNTLLVSIEKRVK